MINTTSKNGFHLTFKNGYTVSVQFKANNYISDRNRLEGEPSKDAEVACWGKNGAFISLGSDDVRGYCDADSVARFIATVQKIDPTNPPTSILDW